MKKLQCENCGAPLISTGFGRYKCEYCGTHYQEDNMGYLRIITSYEPCVPVQAEGIIDREMMVYYPEESIHKMIEDDLTYKLIEKVKDYITFDYFPDWKTQQYICRARMRVVPRDYKF